MNAAADETKVDITEDVCALPLVRRLAALLDHDPDTLREGDALPHGWHVTMFNPPQRQSQLRHDGAAGVGVVLPDIGLPRLMLGGRQIHFFGEIPIGARVRRESRQGEVRIKQGRSGRFALVNVEHRLFVGSAAEPVLIESNDYVLREAGTAISTAAAAPAGAAGAVPPRVTPDAVRTIVPDEAMLFRYSAITDNPHRIHFDQPYATGVEGYPALVVNGSLPAMFLLDMFRAAAGREIHTFDSRNAAPLLCGRPLRLCIFKADNGWRLWAEDDQGRAAFEAQAS